MAESDTDTEEDYNMDDDDDEESSSTDSDSLSSPTSSSTSSSDSSEETESDFDEPLNEKITLRKDKRAKGRWKLLSEKNVFKKEWLEIFVFTLDRNVDFNNKDVQTCLPFKKLKFIQLLRALSTSLGNFIRAMETLYQHIIKRMNLNFLQDWLDEHPDDPKLAICNKCYTTMKAHKGILETHQKSKKHLKNTGEWVEPTKEDKSEEKPTAFPHPPGMEHIQVEDQIGFFSESPADAAHQAVTSIIDKLVDKYHKNRIENLQTQNEVLLKLNAARARFQRDVKQRFMELRMQKEQYAREAEETKLRFLQLQHETKINAMEDERDAKLKAVEQELVFAKQEYEKKVRLLDSQLSSMK